MYNYIHIHIMYTYYVSDVPINFDYVCARMTLHTYVGTLNNRLVWTVIGFLRNAYKSEKVIIMNNYSNKKFYLIYIVPISQEVNMLYIFSISVRWGIGNTINSHFP